MHENRAVNVMLRLVILIACTLAAGAVVFPAETPVDRGSAKSGRKPDPVRIIFDTDMDTDCDDGGALAMLHALADRGEIEILATVVSSKYEFSVPCVEAVNRYYGRPDLLIGCPKGRGASTRRGSRYAKQIAGEFSTRFKSNADAPNATEVYRRVLAAQPDGGVAIVTVGYLTNLRDLLESKADEHSASAGPALVKRKVKHWVCMGGDYPEHLDPGVFGNLKPDPEAAVKAVADWPTEIFFSGLGKRIQTGAGLEQTPATNPARRIYKLYLGERETRSSWDQVALLYAARPNRPYWQLHTTGYNHVFENGTNQWRKAPDKNHTAVLFAPEDRATITAEIEKLMIQAPRAVDRR